LFFCIQQDTIHLNKKGIAMLDVIETTVFNKWLKELKDLSAKAAILARINRAKNGNFGDHKSVGDGLYEMRIMKGAGYRVYQN